jgi:hypothetical protein
MPVYVLDSNFFIQAHRFHYPIDVAAGFWNKVRQLAEEGRVISIDKVKKIALRQKRCVRRMVQKQLT